MICSNPKAITQAKRSSFGFSLIELLAVIAILATIASMVVLNLGNDPQRILDSTAKRFVGQIELMSEEAAMRGIEFGLHVDEDDRSYQFLVYADNKWQKNTIPEYAKAIKVSEYLNLKIELTDEFRVNMLEGNNTLIEDDSSTINGNENNLFPQVAILSSGEFTPFTLSLETEDESEMVIINVDMQGKHELKREIDFS